MSGNALPITLYVIQCGDTQWDDEGRVQGATDLPLSSAGRSSLNGDLHLIGLTPSMTIFHPSDEAATETAKFYAERLNAKTKVAAELENPDLGLLEGLTEEQFADRFPSRHKQWSEDLLSLSPPEGEPIVNAAERMFHGVARLCRKPTDDGLALVLHEIGVGLLRCWLADLSFHEVWNQLADRPRIERYALSKDLIDELKGAVPATVSAT